MSSDITLDLNEHNTLAFDIEVDGASLKDMKAKFVIESNGMEIAFDGKIADKEVEVELPSLVDIIKPDTYECKLAFIVEGDKYFEPMKATIDFIKPVTVSASVKTTKKTTVKESDAPKIRVKRKQSIKDRILKNLDVLAGSTSYNQLQNQYKKLVNEGSDVNKEDMLDKLDTFCTLEHGKNFKDYIKSIK